MKNFSSKNLYLIRIIANKLKSGDPVKPIDLSKIAGLPIMGCLLTKFVIYNRNIFLTATINPAPVFFAELPCIIKYRPISGIQ